MHDALHEGPNKEKAPHDLAVQTAPSADLIAVGRSTPSGQARDRLDRLLADSAAGAGRECI